MPVRVVVDIREDDLWDYLNVNRAVFEKEGWIIEKAPLDVGDIAFYAPQDISGVQSEALMVLLERKTAEDLGASQKDGRYREQRQRLYALRGTGTAIAYILESPPWTPALTNKWCMGKFTEINLQQAILRLQLRHTIPVIQSTSLNGTIQWIRRIAKGLVTDPMVYKGVMAQTAQEAASAYKDAIHVKKASNNSPDSIFLSMILTIPGLGKASAEAIATHTKSSFSTLQALEESQIAEITAGKRKVGKAVAKAVYAALHT